MRINGWTAGAAYLLALLLILVPLAEAVANTLPFQWSNVAWRFAAAGLLSRGLMTPMIGAMVGVGLAMALQHTRVLAVAAVVLGLFGLSIAAGLVLFGLDALTMRKVVAPEALDGIYLASGAAGLKMCVVCVISLALGMGAWQGHREGRSGLRESRKQAPVLSPGTPRG